MGYTTAQQLRERLGSCGAGYQDPELNRLITFASNFIEHVTSWWFESRDMIITVDGRGSDLLLFPVPIVKITKVELVDDYAQPSFDPIELSDLAVYNRHLTQNLTNPDDRKNPKIAFLMSTQPGVRRTLQMDEWPEGHQNIRVTGKFGYTEVDPDAGRSIPSHALDVITAPDAIHMENGAFTQEDVGRTIIIVGSASNDGSYVIAAVGGAMDVTTVEQTLTTEGSGFTATTSFLPQWGRIPIAIVDVCERLCIRDLPSVPGGGAGGPQDPEWYERWMRSLGRVTQEKVRDQSISFAALGSGGGGGNIGGPITGDPYIDMILLEHSRPPEMRYA